MLFARQRQLLQLLDALGGSEDTPDFPNLLFLYCQELAPDRPYDFVPSISGPLSFTADADRRKLIARGLLADEEDVWQITDAGRDAVGRTPGIHTAAFARRHSKLRGDALTADIFRRFPFFATPGEIATRVLGDDRVTLARIEARPTAPDGAALHTIGYEGRSLESFLVLLLESGITLLCDVRRNPISRKYGFSKSTLARGCEAVGIRYEHLPELGIASEKRQGLDTRADYDALFDEYERTWLPAQDVTLEKIHRWIADGERVALTCYERSAHECHRHCVAEALEARSKTTHTIHL
jgi:hypothetical protein